MSGKDTQLKLGWWLIINAISLLFGLGLGIATLNSQATKMQAEAVKAGHARYIILDEFGKTKFEWKEACLPFKIEPVK